MKKSYLTALLASAVFALAGHSLAQVEVIDRAASPVPAPAEQPQTAATQQGELFYQLQLLQQEVMQLRGLVEEQGYQLQKLKKQGMERYIDLDSRVAALSKSPQAASSASSQTAPVKPVTEPSQVVQAGEKEAYNKAYKLVTEKQFESALASFRQFLVDYPAGRYAPNSYYWMGELYQVVNPQDLESARQAFMQLLEQFPEHAKVPDAMYKLGKVYFMKGNKEQARHWLEKVMVEHGGSGSSAPDKASQFLKANF
jgi:tol-pal system protein YbgF